MFCPPEHCEGMCVWEYKAGHATMRCLIDAIMALMLS